MRLPKLADKKACTGCLACLDACAKQAISLVKGDDGHFYVEVDADSCVGCLKCEHICSKIHDKDYSNNKKESVPLAIYNKEKTQYEKATSGGFFPALASYFILQGGVVYGAAYEKDGIHVAHQRISTLADIECLQGSKYEQSKLQGIYKSIHEDLKQDKKVLFVGTGCQVAGVLSYFANHKKKELLYTADLVCGGVPSSLLIEHFAKNTPDFSRVDSYRQKEKYIFSYINLDGKKQVCRKALPLDGFKSCLTNRYSCYNCKFVGLHRQSDWTIGDLWGDHSGKVRSLCLCHSARAMSVVEQLDNVDVERIDWNILVHNPRLVNGVAPFGSRIERKYIGFLFKRMPYSVINKIYGSDVKKTDVFWFAYKTYKYIRFKRYFAMSKQIATKILNS